jgi:hypothetical protein
MMGRVRKAEHRRRKNEYPEFSIRPVERCKCKLD